MFVTVLFLWCCLPADVSHTAENRYPATVSVYFSPDGGCTDAVVRELAAAQKHVLVQAYAFTSAPIAKALLDAHKQGVDIQVLLDQSNVTAQYSSATFLTNAAIPVSIDSQHAIAHNKVMIIDDATVITGSFNFTKAAEHANAENLVILKDSPGLVQRYRQNWLTHAAHSSAYRAKDAALRKDHATGQGLQSQGTRVSDVPKRNDDPVRGNRSSKIYHLPTCPAYDTLSPKNIVSFPSEAEARRAGYRKADNCP
jgi:phosphatidylserine/phosphatidylglycerophosphate/cardiolipin synthase-like enzyme